MMKRNLLASLLPSYQVTTWLLVLLITVCTCQVVIEPVFVGEISPSTPQSSSSSPDSQQIVRIVVNTVVSSDEGKSNGQQPVVNNPNPVSEASNVHSAVLSFPGGGQHIRPSSSRPEKRKADGSLFFPDGNIMGHGITEPSISAKQEAAYTAGGQSSEVNVQIAEHGAKPPSQTLPTGLVTTMGGTVVQGGQTTVHETKVIGTYIDGIYAQILQSTSKIFEQNSQTDTGKNVVIATMMTASSDGSSSSAVTVTPTEATSVVTATKITISPTPTTTSGKWPHLKSRPSYTGVARSKSSSGSKQSSQSVDNSKTRYSRELSPSPTTIKPSKTFTPRSRNSKNLFSSLASQRSRLASMQNRKLTPYVKTITPTPTPTDVTSPSAPMPSESVTLKNGKSVSSRKSRSRSTIRAKSSARSRNADKNAIRPMTSVPRFTYTPNPNKYNPRRRRLKSDNNSSEVNSGESQEAHTIEITSAVILSTITSTITTELTQYFGPKDNSNSLVFTTTYEQPVVITIGSSGDLGEAALELAPSEPMQIISVSSSVNAKPDGSSEEGDIFNPFFDDPQDGTISLAESNEASTATPPLPSVLNSTGSEVTATPVSLTTTTEDVTTTETILQTSYLPILEGTSTAVYTLTQSFFVTKIVHALRTVPPPELMSLVISLDLNAAESEHREDSVSPDGDVIGEYILGNSTSDVFSLLNLTDNDVTQRNRITDPLTSVSSDPPTEPPTPPPAPQPPVYGNNPFFNPFINPFAYLGYGGMPPVVPGSQPILTTSKPVYSTETIYGTKIVPIWDGLSTSYHTTKAPSSTRIHTSFETFTTHGPPVSQPIMPYPPNNFQQPMQTVTSAITVVTTETLTSTQVLKLMYDGYKTSYRTLLSTSETVKTITTQTTTTLPLGQFPGFFG